MQTELPFTPTGEEVLNGFVDHSFLPGVKEKTKQTTHFSRSLIQNKTHTVTEQPFHTSDSKMAEVMPMDKEGGPRNVPHFGGLSASQQLHNITEDFLSPDLRKDGALKYLEKIGRVVKEHRGKKIKLKRNVVQYKFRIGSFINTSYKDTPDLLEEWEQFYLEDHMKMEVIGVLEEFPCNAASAELVLMVCEDGKVFGFEEERLHLVANNLRDLFASGVQFPGIKYFYRGQSFEEMTDEEWDEVKKSEEVAKKEKEHQAMLKAMECSFLENLRIIKQRQHEKEHPAAMGDDPCKPVAV